MNDLSLDEEQFKQQQRERLIYLRRISGYTLSEVAEKVGWSRSQVQNHEIGLSNIYSYQIKKYAQAYNKPVSYFYGTEDSQMISDLVKDKGDLLIAAEVCRLQDDVKLTVFRLVKQINKSLRKSESTEHAA
jgi:transcriptional regulator with XRE-family HTH domain